MRRQLPAWVVAAAIVPAASAAALLSACSPGDGTDIADRSVTVVTDAATTTTTDAEQVIDAEQDTEQDTGQGTGPAGDATDQVVDPSSSSAEMPTPAPVTVSIVEVPETGVPGLDSDDEFCAAWSRFGGSFQMIAVNAAFGDGTPESVAELEEVASKTVVDAYDDLGTHWPAALESERDVALVDGFGPFATRMSSAADELVAAGATPDQIDLISAAWFDALETRAPDSAEVTVDLPDGAWEVVGDAARRHLETSGTWFDDTSLVTRVETPMTDEYLATQCPDQGALAGGDADG